MSVASDTTDGSYANQRFGASLRQSAAGTIGSLPAPFSHRGHPSSHAREAPGPDVTGSFRRDYSHNLVERGKLRLNQMGTNSLMGTVLGIVITAIVGFVGLTAMQETQEATNVTSGQFSEANDALVNSINTAYSLIEVAFIVVILGIVIAALVGLRGRPPAQ
jgi:hypothetical protein